MILLNVKFSLIPQLIILQLHLFQKQPLQYGGEPGHEVHQKSKTKPLMLFAAIREGTEPNVPMEESYTVYQQDGRN